MITFARRFDHGRLYTLRLRDGTLYPIVAWVGRRSLAAISGHLHGGRPLRARPPPPPRGPTGRDARGR
jgi:hypothetical protein